MEKLLNKLKANEYRSFEIMGSQMLEIISEEDIDMAQEGFRFNPIKNEVIEDWSKIIGDDYYVVGFDTTLGDPIIVDISSEGLPVYTMMIDKWESIRKISNSFDELISNLKELDDRINKQRQDSSDIKKFAISLDEKDHTAGFYETLCFDILDEEGLLYEEYTSKK